MDDSSTNLDEKAAHPSSLRCRLPELSRKQPALDHANLLRPYRSRLFVVASFAYEVKQRLEVGRGEKSERCEGVEGVEVGGEEVRSEGDEGGMKRDEEGGEVGQRELGGRGGGRKGRKRWPGGGTGSGRRRPESLLEVGGTLSYSLERLVKLEAVSRWWLRRTKREWARRRRVRRVSGERFRRRSDGSGGDVQS